MPKISKYTFPMRELAEILVREQGIESGHWEAGIELRWAPMNNMSVAGSDPLPGFTTQIAAITLTEVPEPTPSSVDAARIAFPSEIDTA